MTKVRATANFDVFVTKLFLMTLFALQERHKSSSSSNSSRDKSLVWEEVMLTTMIDLRPLLRLCPSLVVELLVVRGHHSMIMALLFTIRLKPNNKDNTSITTPRLVLMLMPIRLIGHRK